MNISIETFNRKGATSVSAIPSEILNLLNKGLIESVNLTEWLAIDHSLLASAILPETVANKCVESLSKSKKQTAMQSILTISKILYQEEIHKNKDLFNVLSTHLSDSVRCWATYLVGLNTELNIQEKLNNIKLFAADKHFGVREIAWMAVREDITSNLEDAISILTSWTSDTDPNIRRFASEAIRPRGVWCKHIEVLKSNPEIAVTLLDQLKFDKDKYVKDSIGNWLNDASKTQPQFVIDLCKKWTINNDSKDTAYIIKKALRTISKIDNNQ